MVITERTPGKVLTSWLQTRNPTLDLVQKRLELSFVVVGWVVSYRNRVGHHRQHIHGDDELP